MELIFKFIGFTGLILTISSLLIWYKQSRKRVIYEFDFKDSINELKLKSNETYAICVQGAGFIQNKDFLKIKNRNGELIKLRNPIPKYRFRRKRKMSIEYLYLRVNNSGLYSLLIENSETVIAKKSMLFVERYFQPKINYSNLKILIKEVVRMEYRIYAIFGLILGVNATVWGIFIGFTDFFKI